MTNKAAGTLANAIVGFVGIIVALAIAFGLTSKVLVIPFIPEIITVIAGWIIIVGVILAVLAKLIAAVS